MPRPPVTADTTAIELAAIVSEALEQAGIIATLTGGGAVSVHTDNRYQSEDLDFVTAAVRDELERALEPVGFVHKGTPRLSVFEHPAARWYLEFPAAPLAFGGTYVDPSTCDVLTTPAGRLRIITPTQAIMDRLIAAAAWQDAQSLEQALLVAEAQSNRIQWDELEAWVVDEGIADSREVTEFYRAMERGTSDASGGSGDTSAPS